MELSVYHKDGTEFQIIKEYSFSGIFMSENKLTATVYSANKLTFEVGAYVMYRSQKYSTFKRVTENKTARVSEGIGDAMSYELEFFAPSKILETINFDDYVSKDDTQQYYTGTSIFHFYNNVNELAIRLQANLDRFTGAGVWNVSVDDSVVLEEKQVAISNLKLNEGLDLSSSVFGLDYRIKGYDIVIGGVGSDVSVSFSYGKNNGLYEISRVFESNEDIVTRMKVYGGQRNLPQYYLRDRDAKGRYFTQLMLPNFAKTGIDYVDAPEETIEEYGIREGSKVFDDIFPSIEEVVYQEVRIDEIVSVEPIDLDSDYFTVHVNDLGFDINDYLTSQSPVLSIKGSNSDGSATYLGGYEFEIVEVEGNAIKLLKNQSDNNILPDDVTTVRAGDRFVLLYIEMPYIYVTNAENKLLTRAQEYFQGDGSVSVSYLVKPDEKFVTLQGVAEELVEGDRVRIIDEDLEVDGYFNIQSISIKSDKSILPTYDMKLSNVKSKTLTENLNDSAVNQNIINTTTRINNISNSVNGNLKITGVKQIVTWQ